MQKRSLLRISTIFFILTTVWSCNSGIWINKRLPPKNEVIEESPPSNNTPPQQAIDKDLYFTGVAQVSLAGVSSSEYILVVKWPRLDGDTPTNKIQYKVFVETVGGTAVYSSAPIATITGTDNKAVVSLNKNISKATFRVAAFVSNTEVPSPSEAKISFSPERQSVFRVGSMRVYHGENIADGMFMSARDIDTDPFGNLIAGDVMGSINAICRETTKASYCKNKKVGQVFTLAGSDGNDNGPDEQEPGKIGLGQINDIAVDNNGNVYVTDGSFNKLRVLCFNTTAGACSGKRVGYVYTLIGSNTAADTADNIAAAGAGTGNPNGLTLDGSNILWGDNSYKRIRMLCFESSGLCSGKTVGNHYRIAGTGVASDGPTGPRGTVGTGTVTALARDAGGNLFFADSQFKKIRAICFSTTSGYCIGKTVDNQYTFAGTGSDTYDAPEGAPLLSNLGSASGITFDSSDNLVIFDTKYYKLRVACQTSSGLCDGKTTNALYSLAGTGISGDTPSNAPAASALGGLNKIKAILGSVVATDTTHSRIRYLCTSADSGLCANGTNNTIYRLFEAGARYSDASPLLASEIEGVLTALGTDKKGNILFFSWPEYRMRILCVESTFGLCNGKSKGYSYAFAGTGARTTTSIDDTPALYTPIQEVRGVATDSLGNVYLAEYRSHYLDVVCVNTSGTKGPCAGKTAGNLYHLVGTGSDSSIPASVYAGNDVLPSTQGTAFPQNVLIDSADNVYLMNYQNYTRIAAICYDITAAGFCQGKTKGNLYTFLGNSTSAQVSGATYAGSLAATTSTGKNYGAVFDQYENMILASYFGQAGIDVVCSQSNPGKGICTGKTAGYYYRVAGATLNEWGTGSGPVYGTTDGPGSSTSIGRGRNITIDPFNNILHDSDLGSTRILCNDVTSDPAGLCGGKTVGHIYLIGSNSQVMPGGGQASGTKISRNLPAAVGGTGVSRYINDVILTVRSGTIAFIIP